MALKHDVLVENIEKGMAPFCSIWFLCCVEMDPEYDWKLGCRYNPHPLEKVSL